MKHIAVFSSSRSDWGILEILVREMRETSDIKTSVIATGSHFDARFGVTIDAMSTEHSNLLIRLDAGPVGNTPEEAAAMAGRVTELVGKWLGESTPDAVLVLGDRFEALACGLAAALHNIPIVHLHGGEVTTGAIDDSVRHALSKLARVHFPVHEDYARRLLQMGEAPDSVIVTGSLAVEGLERGTLLSRAELESQLAAELPEPFIVCAIHPVTTSPDEVGAVLDSLERVIHEQSGIRVILTAPAPDPGFEKIEQRFEQWCSRRPDLFSYHASLGSRRFLSLVAHSQGLVGNSSSGLLEIPSLGVPTLNIGSRQEGRIRASSIIDVEPSVSAVSEGLARMLSIEFHAVAQDTVNPIAGERPSHAIIEVIQACDLSGMGPKLFRDLELT